MRKTNTEVQDEKYGTYLILIWIITLILYILI